MRSRLHMTVAASMLVLGLGGVVASLSLAVRPKVPSVALPLASEHAQEPQAQASRSYHLVACGDILLSRTPGKRAAEHGFRYLFAGARKILEGSDLAFANLETPVSYLGEPWPGKPPVVTFRSDPESLYGLAWAGFDVVSLANNHMNDYGPRALEETLAFLDLLGVARTGAGMNLDEARKPAVLDRDGKRFVFLAYAEPIWSARGARADARSMRVTRAELLGHGTNIQLGFSPDSDDGERSPAGLAHASIADMQADMEAAKRELQPDYLFVSVHWGDEHQHYPTAAQRAFGRAAIDAGAAAVLGHHPHVLQGVEFYNGGFILYSMGNFVFDMMADTTYRTAAFHLHLKDGSVDSVVAQPVSIERFAYAPAPATGSTALSIARDIQRWSAYLGTNGTITEAGSVLFSR